MKKLLLFVIYTVILSTGQSQSLDNRLYEIIESVSTQRIKNDITKLVSFGTRHTLSDTLSEERGIGAARRWIKKEFDQISAACDNCLEVNYHRGTVEAGESRRIPVATEIVNVIAIKRGTTYPDRYIIMSGDIDNRVSDPLDAISDNPGANDNASGMAGVLEASRVLSKYSFDCSIIFVGLSGEEQGLYGGKLLSKFMVENNWDVIGIINNDMIGNSLGIDGVKDNRSFRIFSEPTSPKPSEQELIWQRFYGGEVDGPSRQLARYIHRVTSEYMPGMKPMMIYRLDRFGRGGHHRPFNDEGYAGVRIMETHENYNQQHQDIRVENGIKYGDRLEFVDFEYCSKLTTVNAINLASIAWSPTPPKTVMIGGAVQPSTTLRWESSEDTNLKGYKVYWRETTSPQWKYSRWVGKNNEATLTNVIIDNYLFGVVSVSEEGHESIVSYPKTLIPRRN